MVVKMQYALSIMLCSIHVMSSAMSLEQYNQMSLKDADELTRHEGRCIADDMYEHVKTNIQTGVLTTEKAILNTVKKYLTDYVDTKGGMHEGTMRVCCRARGFFVEKYNGKTRPPVLEIKSPTRIESVWVEASDGEPHALYVAEGDSGSVSIWEEKDLTWKRTNAITVEGKPFVQFARFIKAHGDDPQNDKRDRVVIEVENKGNNYSKSELYFYAKKLKKQGSVETYVWEKESCSIAMDEPIKSCALSNGARRCAVVTQGANGAKDRLTVFEKMNEIYTQIDTQQEIDRRIERLVWNGQKEFVMRWGNSYQNVEVQNRRLTIKPMKAGQCVSTEWALEKIMGWSVSYIKPGRLTIRIDYPLAAVVRSLYDTLVTKLNDQKQARVKNQEITQTPVTSIPKPLNAWVKKLQLQPAVTVSEHKSSGNSVENGSVQRMDWIDEFKKNDANENPLPLLDYGRLSWLEGFEFSSRCFLEVLMAQQNQSE